MPKTHTLTLTVGEFIGSDEKPVKRRRTIGAIFENKDGGLYLRLNADALNPTLAALALRAGRKGEDTVIVAAWEEQAQGAARPAMPAAESRDEADDDIPF